MFFIKLDDTFPDHPKVASAGPLASWLYVCGLSYCHRMLTDGFIPSGVVKRLADLDDPAAQADRLVCVGLWDACDGGYQVHDYLEYQQSKAHIEAVSRIRAEVGSRGGKQKASNLLERSYNQPASKTLAKSKQNSSRLQTTDIDKDGERNTARAPAREGSAPAVAASSSDTPYALFEALCEVMDAEPGTLAPALKKKQLGIGKRLLEQGYGQDKVRACLDYLKSQTWRTSTIDLGTVEHEIGKWELNGMPALANSPARASPSGKPTKLDIIRDGLGFTTGDHQDDRNGAGSGYGPLVPDVAASGRVLGHGGRAPLALPRGDG